MTFAVLHWEGSFWSPQLPGRCFMLGRPGGGHGPEGDARCRSHESRALSVSGDSTDNWFETFRAAV